VNFIRLWIIVLALWLAGCTAQTPSPQATYYEATYYLVRHAEKTLEKDDPGLTPAGHKRAQDLSQRLANIPLSKIFSSDYIRTRDTAAPVAKTKQLAVQIYDPRDLEGFAKSLLTQDGHILVVGHSNTTPQLSEFLGGQAGKPIIEATEYNRFYIVTRQGSKVTSRIETFGD